MALLIILFDRPADLDGSGYRERSRNWIAELTRLDGFVEFSAQWNALRMSPNTMVLIRLSSPEAAIRAISDPALALMFDDMRAHGCHNIMAHPFKNSDLIPAPIIKEVH
ncbi:hypothetical protein [Azospirillum himalayense]|uniref:Uncharacterized protein n=1 Tax=Azospirillum himalayense TaxID=654847 RepID=A0ABW0GFT7_9PROT